MAQYESELTKFMRQFLQQHPEEEESRKKGRAIWWDKNPQERSRPLRGYHAPKSGGAEHTFEPLPDVED